MSDDINIHSQNLANLYATSARSNVPISDDETRQAYMAIIERSDAKEQLMNVAKSINQQLSVSATPSQVQIKPNFVIIVNDCATNDIFYKKFMQSDMITVGRKEWCDALINFTSAISRLHFVIVPYFDASINKNKYLIVDVGSNFGIQQINANNNDMKVHRRICTHLKPTTDRTPFNIEVGTTFHLRAGSAIIRIISSVDNIDFKECIICMSNDRIMRLKPCNHLVSCDECYKQLNKCPICNTRINKNMINDASNYENTYAN